MPSTSAAPPGPAPLRMQVVCLDGVPPERRLEHWRNAIEQLSTGADCLVDDLTRFQGRMESVLVGEGASCSAIWGSPQTVSYTEAHLRRRPFDGHAFLQVRQGRCVAERRGVQTLLEPGDVTFYCYGDESVQFHQPSHFALQVMVLPEALLAHVLPNVPMKMGQDLKLDHRQPTTQMLARAMDLLLDSARAGTANACEHLRDVALHSLAAHLAQQGGLHAAPRQLAAYHRARASTFIEQHLAHPDLGPRMVAQALQLSLGHLHRLYHAEGDGAGLMAYVLQRRLQRCREMLENAQYAHVRVAEIGFRWGFKDAAHFSRAFKHAFGDTPRAWRARALQRLAQ